MGEAKFAQSASGQACEEAIESCSPALDQGIRVQTPGGIFDVQWSNEGKATAMGQLSFSLNSCTPAACLTTGCKVALCATQVPTHPRWSMYWEPGC